MSKKNKHKSHHENKERGAGPAAQNVDAGYVQPNQHDVGNEPGIDDGQSGTERGGREHHQPDRRDTSSNLMINGVRAGFRTAEGKLYLQKCPRCKHENYACNVATGICTWCGWKEGDGFELPKSNRVEG